MYFTSLLSFGKKQYTNQAYMRLKLFENNDSIQGQQGRGVYNFVMEQQELPNYIQDIHQEVEELFQNHIEPDILSSWKIVDLPIVVPYTGEEEQTVLAKFKVKLYRFRDQEWKERGVGILKFLEDNETHWRRIIMRAEKIGTIRLNHRVIKQDNLCQLKQHYTDKAWLWSADDYSEEQHTISKVSAKFYSDQDFQDFQIEFTKACQSNKSLIQEKEQQAGGQENDSNEEN